MIWPVEVSAALAAGAIAAISASVVNLFGKVAMVISFCLENEVSLGGSLQRCPCCCRWYRVLNTGLLYCAKGDK